MNATNRDGEKRRAIIALIVFLSPPLFLLAAIGLEVADVIDSETISLLWCIFIVLYFFRILAMPIFMLRMRRAPQRSWSSEIPWLIGLFSLISAGVCIPYFWWQNDQLSGDNLVILGVFGWVLLQLLSILIRRIGARIQSNKQIDLEQKP